VNGNLHRFRVAAALALLAALAAPGCSDDDDPILFPPEPPPSAAFAASGTAAAPNLVRLRSASTTGDVATLEVAIGGPTTSTDVYGFAFDLVLSNPAVAHYIAGSAQFGTALTPSGGQTTVVLAQQSGNRVTVGASLFGGGPGDQIGAGESVILTLRFRVVRLGTTLILFDGSTDPTDPTDDPAAADSTGAVIGSVTFDPSPATLSGV
jgi:hypothetical protein